MRYFIGFVSVVIVGAVITALFFVGSPAAERERQFDERRVSDLQYIADAVTTYWRIHKSIPEDLGQIENFVPPQDPVTQVAYVYTKTGELTYTLCATFSGAGASDESMAYPKAPYPYYPPNFSNHAAGYVCFDQEIHPELLQPQLAP